MYNSLVYVTCINGVSYTRKQYVIFFLFHCSDKNDDLMILKHRINIWFFKYFKVEDDTNNFTSMLTKWYLKKKRRKLFK